MTDAGFGTGIAFAAIIGFAGLAFFAATVMIGARFAGALRAPALLTADVLTTRLAVRAAGFFAAFIATRSTGLALALVGATLVAGLAFRALA